MTHIKLAIILVSIVVFVAGMSGCNTLAITGAAKYKVDLQNYLLQIRADIEKTGIVSEKTLTRFESFLVKHQPEFGEKGSHLRAMEALDELKLANADENGPFQHNNVAKQLINQCQDMLSSEGGG